MDLQAGRTITTDMKNNVPEYVIPAMQTDGATGAAESEWINSKGTTYLGYFKQVPQLNVAIKSFATWIVGRGYETEDAESKVILDHIVGWGEDTFNSIIWNLMVSKKVYGDAFAEIIRDEKTGTLLNLKPLDPSCIKVIANSKGRIKRYEQVGKTEQDKGQVVQKFKPEEILHLCNDRIADEIHGCSMIEPCEKVITWIQQILDDWATVLHRNVIPVRIIEVETDNENELDKIRQKYENMVKNKEVLIVPKGTVSITTDGAGANSIVSPLPFLNYLDNYFYQVLGVPKIILGGGQEFTEASSKIAYLSYEQVYVREQTEFIADFWNQIGIRIKLNPPVSLHNELLTDNSKDAGQLTTQPNDLTAGAGA